MINKKDNLPKLEQRNHNMRHYFFKYLCIIFVCNSLWFCIGFTILKIHLISSIETIIQPALIIMILAICCIIPLSFSDFNKKNKKKFATFVAFSIVTEGFLMSPISSLIEKCERNSIEIQKLDYTNIRKADKYDIVRINVLEIDTSKVGNYVYSSGNIFIRHDFHKFIIHAYKIKSLPNTFFVTKYEITDPNNRILHKENILLDKTENKYYTLLRLRRYDGINNYLKAIKQISKEVNFNNTFIFQSMDYGNKDPAIIYESNFVLLIIAFFLLIITYYYFFAKSQFLQDKNNARNNQQYRVRP